MDDKPEARALLVEDDPGERWIMSEILRSRGHLVVSCETAESAWKRYQEDPFPLVILDWLLPGMDGLELCRKIRRHPRGDRTVIVVVTIKDEPRHLNDVLRAGADDYMAKPIDVGLMHIRLAVAEAEAENLRHRKEAQDAFESKSRELERFYANVDRIFFTVDAEENRLTRVSPGTERILGIPAEKLRRDPDLWRTYLFPSELRERTEDLDAPRGASLTHRYPVEAPTGEPLWLEATVKAADEGSGSISRIDGVVSDVTLQREHELELAERNRELETLNRLTETVFAAESLDEAYRQIVVEVAETTGFPIVAIEHADHEAECMVIRAARGLPDAHQSPPMVIPFHRTLSGVAVQTARPVIVGDALQHEAHTDPVLTRLGIRTYLSYPITLHGRVDATLTLADTRVSKPDPRQIRWVGTLANTLATLIDRLGAHEALVRSERRHRAVARRLQQANEELEAFAYTVSHDLRAPLRTMEGFAHALLADFGDELPSEAADYARRIVASGKHAEQLIGDLLAYSRLSFEEIGLQKVELEEVVDRALEQLAQDLRSTGGDVRVEHPLPAVLGHGSTLVQVVANLVSNALKFVDEGVVPEVRIHAEERGPEIRLWVEDNGIGVPPDHSERVFRVFERLVESGNRPGTGIGLAIVRRGMQRIGGRAGVESDGTSGSRFWIQLPGPHGPEDEDERDVEPASR